MDFSEFVSMMERQIKVTDEEEEIRQVFKGEILQY